MPKLLVVLLLLVVLAGCGSNGNDGGDEKSEWVDGPKTANEVDCSGLDEPGDYMQSDELTERVVCTIPAYQWPDDRQPDGIALVDSVLSDLPPGRFQRGYEHNILSGANICVWLGYWEESRVTGDAEAVEIALAYLEGPGTRFENEITGYPAGDDPGIAISQREAVSKARLGDASGLTRNLQGCAPVPLQNNDASSSNQQNGG